MLLALLRGQVGSAADEGTTTVAEAPSQAGEAVVGGGQQKRGDRQSSAPT